MKRAVCILLILMFSLTPSVFYGHVIDGDAVQVDFGSFSGDTDYGGSDYSGGSDSYSGDYYGGYYGDGDSDGLSGGEIFIGIVIFALLVVFVTVAGNKKKRSVAAGAQPVSSLSLRPVSEYLSIDKNFSEKDFCEKLSNIYVQLQVGWQAGDISPVRVYLSDSLFNQSQHQLEGLKRQNRTNHIDNIAVLSVDISGFMQDEKNDLMVARLKTRIIDYTVDNTTGSIVSGSNTAEKFMEYEWILARTRGRVTDSSVPNFKKTSCPSCGAPIEVNYSAKCEYCDTVLNSGDYDWVISEMKGISQTTA